MNNFERFQNRNGSQRMEAQKSLNSHFILKGYPSIRICGSDRDVEACVVNQQEKEQAYIYTLQNVTLDIGSVWSAKGLHWLIAEEIITIKDVKWHKYKAFICNVQINDTWGYYIGTEKTYINVKLELKTALESLAHPILIVPENVLTFKDKIVIKNRAWLVQEYDNLSTPGISYCSLRATTVSTETAQIAEEEGIAVETAQVKTTNINLTPDIDNIIGHNINITLPTSNGFFTSNKEIKVVSRTKNQIIFYIPFGIDEVEVSVIDPDSGEQQLITYKAVD